MHANVFVILRVTRSSRISGLLSVCLPACPSFRLSVQSSVCSKLAWFFGVVVFVICYTLIHLKGLCTTQMHCFFFTGFYLYLCFYMCLDLHCKTVPPIGLIFIPSKRCYCLKSAIKYRLTVLYTCFVLPEQLYSVFVQDIYPPLSLAFNLK